MKFTYNLATVATFSYFPFLLSFLGSFFYQYRTDFPGKLILGVDSFPVPFKDSLSQYRNVELVELTQDLKCFEGVHGDSWRRAVSKKLEMSAAVLQKTQQPLLLIDNDIVFTARVDDLWEANYDVVVTRIENSMERHVRRDGLLIDYIGSAVFFKNVEKSLLFIKGWQTLMSDLEKKTYPPYETPALNLLLNSSFLSLNQINVGIVKDHVIACDQCMMKETRAIHLKSWGPSKDGSIKNYWSRVARGGFNKTFHAASHLDFSLYEKWLLHELYGEFGS